MNSYNAENVAKNTDEFKQFFKANQDLLNRFAFDKLYENFKPYFRENFDDTTVRTSDLTYLLYKSGFDPLNYLSTVPEFYSFHLEDVGIDTINIYFNIRRIDNRAFCSSPFKKFIFKHKNVVFLTNAIFWNLDDILIIWPGTKEEFFKICPGSPSRLFSGSTVTLKCTDGDYNYSSRTVI